MINRIKQFFCKKIAIIFSFGKKNYFLLPFCSSCFSTRKTWPETLSSSAKEIFSSVSKSGQMMNIIPCDYQDDDDDDIDDDDDEETNTDADGE